MRLGQKLRRDRDGHALAPGIPALRLRPCRKELAWAAGFYDAEGSTFLASRGHYPVIGISQSDDHTVPAVLVRFHKAVGGIGHINGPFRLGDPRFKVKWIYRVHGHQMTQATIAQLWPWLGSVKRKQAIATLLEFRRSNPPRTRVAGTTFGQPFQDRCKRGHDLSFARVSPDRSRECLFCRHERYLEPRVTPP